MPYLYIIPENGLKLSAIKPAFVLYIRKRFITKIINKRQGNSEVPFFFFLPGFPCSVIEQFMNLTNPPLDNGKSNVVFS